MLFRIGLILILPLFPAEPKLGPVYQQVTHFIPPDFPLLFIVPAFVLDLFWQRTKAWNPWKIAAVSSIIWVANFPCRGMAVRFLPHAEPRLAQLVLRHQLSSTTLCRPLPSRPATSSIPHGRPAVILLGLVRRHLIRHSHLPLGSHPRRMARKDQALNFERQPSKGGRCGLASARNANTFLRSLPLLCLAALAQAHVGSPDIFLEGKAGPYRSSSLSVRLSPSPVSPKSKSVPNLPASATSKPFRLPSRAPVRNMPHSRSPESSPGDPQFFTGALWMMTSGSWQARLTVDGAQGDGTLAIPVPSFARASKNAVGARSLLRPSAFF